MSDRVKKVLYINLKKKSSEIKAHSDLEASLGGAGLGTVLFSELCDQDPIILCNGPLSAIFPCCSEAVAVFKSPLSGNFGEEYTGGWLAAVMKFALLDAIVITGESKAPIFLNIENENVEFKEATTFWGRGNIETVDFLEKNEGIPGQKSVLTIGQAGEKGIAFSSVLVDSYFGFQRLGLGAVFGKKKLKGIVISGTKEITLPDFSSYQRLYQKILDLIAEETSKQLPLWYVRLRDIKCFQIENELGGLPTKNLKEARFEEASKISPEVFSSLYDSQIASFGCPIRTTPLIAFEDKKIPVGYEGLASLGPLLGISDPQGILQLLEKAYNFGLDPVSLGVCLAYFTEHQGLNLSDSKTCLILIENLIKQTDSWARLLSLGVEKAAKSLGGRDYALSLGGVEIAPYFNGYATVLGQLLGATQCIQDNNGHILDLVLIGKDFSDEELVTNLLAEEKKMIILNSLGVNHFAQGIYFDFPLIFSVLDSVGVSWSRESLERFSKEVYHLKLGIKKMWGFDIDQIPIPKRIFETPSAYGILRKERLRNLLEIYKEKIKEPK